MSHNLYGGNFHHKRHEKTQYAAHTVLDLASQFIPRVHSAIDIGCGVGTWLSVLMESGVKEIHGIDGPWVEKKDLVIPEEAFTAQDLSNLKSINKKYDLAISLEVGEHLPETCADSFVETLTRLADFVIFSAAHPYQGGVGHINEQWLDYWINKFEKQQFTAFDLFRKEIWNNEKIPACYRNNLMLFVSIDRINDLNLQKDFNHYTPPEKYLLYFKKLIEPGILQSLSYLRNAVKRRFVKRKH